MSSLCIPESQSTWQEDAITETYEGVQKMIYKIAHKITAGRHIPFEDAVSAANVIFMHVLRRRYKAKPGKRPATFTTRLHNSLNWELLDYLKEERRHIGHAEVNEEMLGAEDHNASFRLALEGEISESTREIVALILDSHDELSALCQWEDVKTRSGFLSALKEHLLDVGYTVDAVRESFAELRAVMGHTRCAGVDDPTLLKVGIPREHVWLQARVGLTPAQVRAALGTA